MVKVENWMRCYDGLRDDVNAHFAFGCLDGTVRLSRRYRVSFTEKLRGVPDVSLPLKVQRQGRLLP